MGSANFDEMFNEAQKAIDQLEPRTVFEVKSLFKGTAWSNLERGEKISFGVFFSKKYQSEALPLSKRLSAAKTTTPDIADSDYSSPPHHRVI